ncbi:MAG: aldo/keto reductase [Muribaculaceae bacterium]
MIRATRILGKNGPEVSAVGLGCMGMSHAYGAARDHKEMAILLAQAVELGYTLFDTAEIYGTPHCPHDNEEMLGKALKAHRDDIVLSTKFGVTFSHPESDGPHAIVPDSDPAKIRTSLEGSLRRLQTDHIDIYFQHRPDPKVAPEEVAAVMQDLINEGKILHWGVSEASEEYIRRAHAVCPLAAIQNRYSMMARWHESLFPMLEELGIGFMAFSPLANGLLSDRYTADSKFDAQTDYRASMPQFSKDSFEQNKQLMALVNEFAAKHDATPAQISLAWMMSKKPYIVPIPGTRHLERLKENIAAADVVMTADEVKLIDEALASIEMSEVFGGSKVISK